MSNDPFSSVSDSLIAPARVAIPITPSDSAELPGATKAIYVGTGGDITLRMIDSASDVSFRNIASGTVLALRLVAVRATGTTAGNIIGLA